MGGAWAGLKLEGSPCPTQPDLAWPGQGCGQPAPPFLWACGQASCMLGAPAQAGWREERKNMRFGGLDMEKQAN